MSRHLHVLTSPGEKLQRIHLINALAYVWREAGDTVSFGHEAPDGVDAVINHTDYSVTPERFFDGIPKKTPIINGNAHSILKADVSQMLLQPSSEWSGPVIIKTNANAHAAEEYVYHRLDIPRLLKILAGKVIPWQWTGELPLRTYPILKSLKEVPDWVWQDDGLVVEKFMPERDGELYVLRLWMFFGNQEYAMKVTGRLPIVKSRALVNVEMLKDVPDEVRAVRKRLGLDFGKIDYVEHDGKATVFDVNKTPTIFLNKSGEPGAHVRRLATGLDDLLGKVS